jgi:hypothetical protein
VTSELAKLTLKGLISLDGPIGQIMEIVREMEDGPRKALLKEQCEALLRVQFELIEGAVEAYPDLRSVVDRDL